MMPDIFVYTPDNLLAQLHTAPLHLGYHTLYFYVDAQGRLAKEPTDQKSLNIVLYSAKFDRFKGYGKAE
jgi:hypothetical protein